MTGLAAVLLRGIGVGGFLVSSLGVWRSGLGRDVRLITALACLSAAAWTLAGDPRTAEAIGLPAALAWAAFPAAGLFWAFVVGVFQDQTVRLRDYGPAAGLMLLGGAVSLSPPAWTADLRAAFNIAAGGLGLHALYLVLRGWRGDLVDSRRVTRLAILGLAALIALAEGAAGALEGLGRGGAWTDMVLGDGVGSAAGGLLGLAMGALVLQARSPLFSIPPAPVALDAGLTAADRLLLKRLEAFMSEGGWRREGLGIGDLAGALGTREHRLRRLINTRLGHRNFADYVNGWRIAAARTALADPARADMTIAGIAFELGFGSLSPFNRAFRAATGLTPTAWRREALSGAARPGPNAE